ncbi:hypothetical protein LWI29_035530 [Acer saccharum]|uniref:RNase H type-1 domain-containing protein n=1 Tax=Acer saccharum TaxID=4024 RepID=A0AA39TPC4_ACESA|nr:hypothetical protein LWI29_035530 [Acer saccharum]
MVVSTDPDSLVWTCSLDGVVSCKSAYDSLSEVRSSVFWGKQIWASFIPSSRSVLIWRLFHGVFRTCRGFIRGCFAIPLGVCFAFEAELAAAVHAIDYAWTFGWHRLWLESDSTFVVNILLSRSRKVPKR